MVQPTCVGLVGTGNVGMAAAYAMFQRSVAGELVLVDRDARRAEGEALDLMHGQGYVGRVRVTAGGYPDLARAQVIVVSAGVSQQPGETRLDLLARNVAIFRNIAAELDRHAPEARIVVATNPVDIMTYMLQELTARPPERVIGTGTMLDTSRFRALLARYYDVDPRSVHAYILGEHGDTEVPIWSQATIGGYPLLDRTVLGRPFDREALDALFERVRRAAYEIIERKGYTNWAIGLVIARVVEVILQDQKSVLAVSVRQRGEYGVDDVCFSTPTVVGAHGVERSTRLELPDEELDKLRHSAAVLRESLVQLAAERP